MCLQQNRHITSTLANACDGLVVCCSCMMDCPPLQDASVSSPESDCCGGVTAYLSVPNCVVVKLSPDQKEASLRLPCAPATPCSAPTHCPSRHTGKLKSVGRQQTVKRQYAVYNEAHLIHPTHATCTSITARNTPRMYVVCRPTADTMPRNSCCCLPCLTLISRPTPSTTIPWQT